jgi:hypothetical protein
LGALKTCASIAPIIMVSGDAVLTFPSQKCRWEPGDHRVVAGPDLTKSTESDWQLGGGGELVLFTAEVAIVFQRALEQLIAAVVELTAVLAQV